MMNAFEKEQYQKREAEQREARLFDIILNKIVYIEGFYYDTYRLPYRLASLVREIDNTYTKAEIRTAIDKLYFTKYYDILYEDFLFYLAYKNATLYHYKKSKNNVNYYIKRFYEIYSFYQKTKNKTQIVKEVMNTFINQARLLEKW